MAKEALHFFCLLLYALEVIGDALSNAEKQGILDKHNTLRASIGSPCTASDMETMVWDDSLASDASTYADGCVGDHATGAGSQFGENLWMQIGSSTYTLSDVTGAVQEWYDEIADVEWVTDKNNNFIEAKSLSGDGYPAACKSLDTANGNCFIGHFTQVVWAKSNKIGCGIKQCSSGLSISGSSYNAGVLIVCRYTPAGNAAAAAPNSPNHVKMPFTPGFKCVSCTSGICSKVDDGLCPADDTPIRCTDTAGPITFNSVAYSSCTTYVGAISAAFSQSGLWACTQTSVASLIDGVCDLTCSKCSVPVGVGSANCGAPPPPVESPSPAQNQQVPFINPEPEPGPGGAQQACGPGRKQCVEGMSSWCIMDWDACPCADNEEDCYTDSYDDDGLWIGQTHSCVADLSSCPCATGEQRCTDTYGSWCSSDPCPCAASQKTCFDYSYDNSGIPTGTGSSSCVNNISQCSCTGTGALSTPCADEWGESYTCLASATNTQCPITCDFMAGEFVCDQYPFTSAGQPDYSGPYNETCGNMTAGCPCNPQWEQKCTWDGYSYCQSIFYDCPKDCGNDLTCSYYDYFANGSYKIDQFGSPKLVEQCVAGATTCPCDSTHELSCNVTYGGFTYQYCFEKVNYPDGCPIDCGSRATCFPTSFDSNGFPVPGQAQCADDCDDLCGANAVVSECPDWYYPCRWTGESCPQQCSSDQQFCYSDHFDSEGNYVNTSITCEAADQSCPCSASAKPCSDDFGNYCIPKSETCPVYCDYSTQQLCSIYSYYPNGSFDYNTPVNDTCLPKTATCPCGANAEPCSETMDDGTKHEWCQPQYYEGLKLSCPVTCTGTQVMCMRINYDTQGKLLSYQETCIGPNAICPCGGNNTRCTYQGDSWCQPSWDTYLNALSTCPVDCNSTQHYCAVPNYDGFGDFTSTTDYCENIGTACDCNRGQNGKTCVQFGFSECIPRVGDDSYCPVTCLSNQVSCHGTDNFNPTTGEWIGFTPSKTGQECKATYAECPCGTGARKCSNGECVPNYYPCPAQCTGDQVVCEINDFNSNGTITKKREICIASNATCPCGVNANKCWFQLDGFLSSFCLASAFGNCPCKASQSACRVIDYDTNGEFLGDPLRCVALGNACPCGKNTKSCVNPQNPTETKCEKKFGKESSDCPSPCTTSQEVAGKKTCIRSNVNGTGHPTSKITSCESGECPIGRGLKKCPAGNQILSGFSCRDIYGLGAVVTSSRRLAATQIGETQSASLSFTLENLVSTSKNIAGLKVQVDSVLQVPTAVSTELVMSITTLQGAQVANMQYNVKNLGVSTVSPQKITAKFESLMNAKDPSIVNVLKALGTVKMGSGTGGCCSKITNVKTQVVTATTSQSTTESTSVEPMPMPVPGGPEPEPGAVESSSTSTTAAAAVPSPVPSPLPSPQPAGQTKIVTGNIGLTVDKPTAFVADSAAKQEVKSAFATAATISSEFIAMTFSVGSRRLRDEGEASLPGLNEETANVRQEQQAFLDNLRRLSGTVNVAYTITLPASMSGADQTAKLNNINSLTTTALTNAISTALSNAGLSYTVSVISFSAVVQGGGGGGGAPGPSPTTSPSSESVMIHINLSTLFFLLASVVSASRRP